MERATTDFVAVAAHGGDGVFERSALVVGDALDHEGGAACRQFQQRGIVGGDAADAIDLLAPLTGAMP